MKMKTLLSVSADSKTVKGEKMGYLTGILYLAPARISGYEVCPQRSPDCTKACLYTAGMGKFSNVQKSRINKTKFYFEDRPAFMEVLRKDIKKLVKKAEKLNLIPCVRLNGTSDLNWIPSGIFQEFPNVTFYDYTKCLNRFDKALPVNYSLTFSRSECNELQAIEVLQRGHNVAIVFDTKKGQELPKLWKGYKVIDGDETDLRFLDPFNVVIGLRAKGSAKGQQSGFVVPTKIFEYIPISEQLETFEYRAMVTGAINETQFFN